jgi:hypothetical protein
MEVEVEDGTVDFELELRLEIEEVNPDVVFGAVGVVTEGEVTI